jgi:hypothetical protein
MADTYDPTVIRGDTLRWAMRMQDSAGITLDLTNSTLNMQVRSSDYPATLYASYSLSVTSGTNYFVPDGVIGGISATGTGGIALICIGSTYTQKLPPYTPAFYEIQQITTDVNDTKTLLRGKINVTPDVTKV